MRILGGEEEGDEEEACRLASLARLLNGLVNDRGENKEVPNEELILDGKGLLVRHGLGTMVNGWLGSNLKWRWRGEF